MTQDKANEIISIIKDEIESYSSVTTKTESGKVVQIADGIAVIYGIDNASYGEIIEFQHGERGIVLNIERKTISCIILGDQNELFQGALAYRTEKTASIGVSDEIIGRVVNPLGNPIDGKGEIAVDKYMPIENSAPQVIDRESVRVPLQTGIVAIDAMVPIGRGQRELIIGDRQTGKTSIAIDTILNQKGKDVLCLYVAIGQKASNIARVQSILEKNGAMKYTTILASTASDYASLQYIAPFAGTSIAEYFMHKGKDVLIVYDDLTKHAAAYRAIALLLKRPPGREAYPGDIFYLHSRLLERSAKLSKELGGGSLTALPIVETLSGDISSYIPTNIISITDGQISLESELFFSGIRPAINVGLSVSRVGGDAQTKAMKKFSGKLRIDLAQFKELEVFTQFGADIDKSTSDILAYGRTLVSVLKQKNSEPVPLYKQIITLFVATRKYLTDIPEINIKNFIDELILNFEENHQDIIRKIEKEKDISDKVMEELGVIVSDFKEKVSSWQI